MLQFSSYPIGKEEDEVSLLKSCGLFKWVWFIEKGVVYWNECGVYMYVVIHNVICIHAVINSYCPVVINSYCPIVINSYYVL